MDWLETDGPHGPLRHRLSLAARDWEATGRGRARAWRADDVSALREWLPAGPLLTPTERAFTEQSLALARSDQRNRTLALWSVIAALVAVVALQVVQTRRLEAARSDATAARAVAETRALVAEARRARAEGRTDEELAALGAAVSSGHPAIPETAMRRLDALMATGESFLRTPPRASPRRRSASPPTSS